MKSTDESLEQVLLQPKCKSGKIGPLANSSSLLKCATLLYSTVAPCANPVAGDVQQKGSHCHPLGPCTHASAVQLQLGHPRWTAKEWPVVKLSLKIVMSHQSLQYLSIATSGRKRNLARKA